MVTFTETLKKLEDYRARMSAAVENYRTNGKEAAFISAIDELLGFADDAEEACTEQFFTTSALDAISDALAMVDDCLMPVAELADAVAEYTDAPWAFQGEGV